MRVCQSKTSTGPKPMARALERMYYYLSITVLLAADIFSGTFEALVMTCKAPYNVGLGCVKGHVSHVNLPSF